MTPAAFAEMTNVSRETLQRLECFGRMLVNRQASVNLVSTGSLAQLWRRHMLDSAQLYPLLPGSPCRIVDFGSGAGFPGLVLAIMGATEVHLIESDRKKARFLAEAARSAGLEPGVNPVIHQARIEDLVGWPADIVTARACAPLDRLLTLAERFLGPNTIALFMKGRRVEDELTLARKHWRMAVERLPSASDSSGTILRLGQIRRG
ncbi:MAG: 16S rRNA (guanine(527)-N(7))-methyltransferase RsmG [Dongiaceae bacterium]